MSISRLILLGIACSLLALAFIDAFAITPNLIFWHLLAIHDLPAAWLMVGMLAFGYWFGARRSGDGSSVEQLLLALDRQRYVVALVLWVALCAGTVWIYQNQPLSMDEYAAVFQAKVFAAGAMHGQFPPDLLDYLVPPRFQNQFLMINRNTGAVFSAYWPGFALLLSPFVWLGIPWACNPTLVVASFLLIGRIARDLIASPLAAGWALLFALASPAFVANGITYYSMPAHLLFNLAFAWLLLAPSPLRLFLAGLVGGFALSLHNPFPHAVFAMPWIVWLATRRGQRLRNMVFLFAGYLPTVLLMVAGWSLWQQQILHAGAQATALAQVVNNVPPTMVERAHGLLRGFTRVFSWPDVFIVFDRLGGLAKLWLWASPLLLLLAWWGGRDEKQPGLRLLGASALLTFIAYFAVPFDQGHGWGYRYFHSAWGVLPVLAALGTIKLAAVEGPRALRQAALLTLLSLVAANGLRFVQMGDFMSAHLAQLPPRPGTERTIVLHNGWGYYALDLIQNDPWLRGDEIILLSRTTADAEKIRKHFPSARKMSANSYGISMVDAGGGQ